MSDVKQPSKEAIQAVQCMAITLWGGTGGEQVLALAAYFDAFAAEAVAAEREACAKIAEDLAKYCAKKARTKNIEYWGGAADEAGLITTYIRGRACPGK